jgi:hypothetical protein
VQPAFKLITQQRFYRLPVAHAFENELRASHSFGRQVDGKHFSLIRRGVAEIGIAQQSGGRGVVERRGVHESTLP